MNIQYSEIIDLTLPIVSNMSVPPSNRKTVPPVELKTLRAHADSGIQVSFYQSPIHAGTHLDSPLHIVDGGETIDRLPLDWFISPAYCVDCSEVEPNRPVTRAMLEKADGKLRPGMMLLIHTGWSDKMFGGDEYWSESPFLGEDGAQWIVEQRVRIAGYDFFQDVGAKPDKLDASKFVVHKILLSKNVLNIEHMTNLGALAGTEFTCIALPLKLTGLEGSPTRAIALR